MNTGGDGREQFTAVALCPSCGDLDIHWLDKPRNGRATRVMQILKYKHSSAQNDHRTRPQHQRTQQPLTTRPARPTLEKQPMNEDENLTPALDALKSAIAALIEPTVAYIENRIVTGDSLYSQLDESLGGTADHPAGGSGSKSKPPVWIEALELITAIDQKVLVWQPGPLGPPEIPETIWRLKVLSARSWRPQDSATLEMMAEDIRYWAEAINLLLDPPKLIPLIGPDGKYYECPVCGENTVRRMNDEGHFEPGPALIAEPGVGVMCQNRRHCRDENTGRPARWPWDAQRLLALGNLLQHEREAKKHNTNQEVA